METYPIVRRSSLPIDNFRFFPYVPITLTVGPALPTLSEPRMLIARMINHEVEDDTHIPIMDLINKLFNIT